MRAQMIFPHARVYAPSVHMNIFTITCLESLQRWITTEWSWNFLETGYQNVHMSPIAEELIFAGLSVTKFENSRYSWDFLEVSQEAKVAPFLSSWPYTATTMSFSHREYLKNAKKWPFFGMISNFL